MNIPKLIAVIATAANIPFWFAAGRPFIAACWAVASIATALFIPAR